MIDYLIVKTCKINVMWDMVVLHGGPCLPACPLRTGNDRVADLPLIIFLPIKAPILLGLIRRDLTVTHFKPYAICWTKPVRRWKGNYSPLIMAVVEERVQSYLGIAPTIYAILILHFGKIIKWCWLPVVDCQRAGNEILHFEHQGLSWLAFPIFTQSWHQLNERSNY